MSEDLQAVRCEVCGPVGTMSWDEAWSFSEKHAEETGHTTIHREADPPAAILNPCQGCGADAGSDVPRPDHCGKCKPWTCDGCGLSCSMSEPCACWIPLAGLGLADLKAIFASSDLSLEAER